MAEIQKRPRKPASLLKVSLRGSDIERSGAVPVPLLIEICKALQSAVTKQAELQAVGDLQPEEYTLELVRLGKGSAVLEFELIRPQYNLTSLVGEAAVRSVVGLIGELGTEGNASELNVEALESLKGMAKVVGPNLKIALYVPKERTATMESAAATFNESIAERVTKLTSKESRVTPPTPKILEGIVEMADFKPSDHKFRLVPLYGPAVVCTFEEEISPAVQNLTRSVVRVQGMAENDAHGKTSLRVDQIVPRGSPFPGGFREKKTIADLIAEQKVRPIKSISELSGIWPDNESKPN